MARRTPRLALLAACTALLCGTFTAPAVQAQPQPQHHNAPAVTLVAGTEQHQFALVRASQEPDSPYTLLHRDAEYAEEGFLPVVGPVFDSMATLRRGVGVALVQDAEGAWLHVNARTGMIEPLINESSHAQAWRAPTADGWVELTHAPGARTATLARHTLQGMSRPLRRDVSIELMEGFSGVTAMMADDASVSLAGEFTASWQATDEFRHYAAKRMVIPFDAQHAPRELPDLFIPLPTRSDQPSPEPGQERSEALWASYPHVTYACQRTIMGGAPPPPGVPPYQDISQGACYSDRAPQFPWDTRYLGPVGTVTQVTYTPSLMTSLTGKGDLYVGSTSEHRDATALPGAFLSVTADGEHTWAIAASVDGAAPQLVEVVDSTTVREVAAVALP